MLNYRRGECTPQCRGSALQIGALAVAVVGVVICPARGLADEPAPARDDALADTADLDGYYLALGPRGGAVHSEDTWDGAFGAEAFLYRYRGGRRLALLGLSGGMFRLSEIGGGHAFADVGAGWDLGLGPMVAGLSLGVTARVHPLRHTRWGAHASVWAFAGGIPYVRAGILQDTGIFADIGIRLALPAVRW